MTAPLALLFETHEIEWRPELIGSLLWLTLVLSIGAILLLMILIRARSAARVSSLFYLVPPATAVEAWLLFGERLGLLAIIGLVVASVGVALVVMTLPSKAESGRYRVYDTIRLALQHSQPVFLLFRDMQVELCPVSENT